MLTMYEHVSLSELLNIADAHTDPLVRELSRRLDAYAFELTIYKTAVPPQPNPAQAHLFKDL